MRRSDFDFALPEALIAQRPLAERSASRLLCLDGAQLLDREFRALPDFLRGDELFVFNDTRVLPARLHARKVPGGARVEVLLERVLTPTRARVQLRAHKPLRNGQRLVLGGGENVVVVDHPVPFFEVELEGGHWVEVCDRLGHVPLPPYIRRADEAEDRTRYQTVFGRHPGAVAAPTAGLHFDTEILDRLRHKGVEFAYVTLHVGAGTFAPMRVEDPREHRMHAEYAEVSRAVCEQLFAARQAGRTVVAVGTTVARTLEAACASGIPVPLSGEIANFIYPGHAFRMVDALITNFHLPQSTLLMLVCALGGTERVLAAYRHAVASGYRFFSYGDAMWVRPSPTAAA